VTPNAARPPIDPRLYQIAALAALLGWGVLRLGFDVTPQRAAILLAGALATQYACARIWRLPAFDPKSALISGLSLCLLLRTNHDALALAAAAAAVASKFLLRWKGKHLFNPTNFGLVALMLATGRVWVSPAQWGSAAFFGFLLACAGGVVVQRAARADVTLSFLGSYLALLLARSAWLGEPLAIPLHRVQSGALLLFAFFMISDPKTTPDSRAGRVLFGALVAFGGAWIQFRLFRTNGFLWSLAACALLVPVIDRLLPGRRYAWTGGGLSRFRPGQGDIDETPLRPGSLVPVALRREPSGPPVLRVLRGAGGREAL
jgi:Na+-transporting NADH:ubiquinone oxidoreductase subunit NqrB